MIVGHWTLIIGHSRRAAARTAHGEGGIRTPDKVLRPYNGLANRRLQPLGHPSNYAGLELSESLPAVEGAGLSVVCLLNRRATASARSTSFTMLYLSNIARVRQPHNAMIVPSSTPARRNSRAAVRRKSCMIRPAQPARFVALCHS